MVTRYLYILKPITPQQFHHTLIFLVDDIDRSVGDITKLGIHFEIYKEGDLKTDEEGICRGKPEISWLKDPLATTCLCL
jgi:hypothetical protein